MQSFDFQARTRLIFGVGGFERLGEIAAELGFRRSLLVADDGMIACGYVEEAATSLRAAGIEAFHFHQFGENPDTLMVEAGRAYAAEVKPDSIIALGGGSSMDCAKGVNFVYTNGGQMKDYWGHDKTTQPMLPMICVPTTAGTGSDAQSYALITDAETHIKMACGDARASFKVAILDPRLTLTMPPFLTSVSGYDALSHAVESYVTKKRNPASQVFAREAWRLLESNYERVLDHPADLEARGSMLLGAFYAGLSIENSMLGATHACANPLTKNYGTTHGVAISVMLPHVVRWNAGVAADGYEDLNRIARLGNGVPAGETLARRVAALARAGELPENLSALNVSKTDLPKLAEEAAKQWTGTFNPRDWSVGGAMEVYGNAL